MTSRARRLYVQAVLLGPAATNATAQIRPGAKRVVSSANRAQLLTTAFINGDGKLAVVVMNPTNETFNYRMYIGRKAVETSALPRSIATLVIQ